MVDLADLARGEADLVAVGAVALSGLTADGALGQLVFQLLKQLLAGAAALGVQSHGLQCINL